MLSVRLYSLFALLFVHTALCASQSPISFSPSPAPELSDAPSVAPDASAPLSSFSSPPAPPPSDLAPGFSPETAPASTLPPSPDAESPVPSPDAESPVPSPSPSSASDINHSGVNPAIDDADSEEHSGGMSGGKKAGIVFLVIFLAGLVVIGAVVYKKRQENIRRSRYSSNARLDFT